MTLALITAAWLMGLLLGFWLEVLPLPLLLLTLSTLPMALLLKLAGRSLWPAVLVGALLLGIWRVELSDAPVLPLAPGDTQTVLIQAKINGDPEATSQRIKFVLEVESIDQGSEWEEASGEVLVYAEPPASLVLVREPPYFKNGDALELRGNLQRPEPIEDCSENKVQAASRVTL